MILNVDKIKIDNSKIDRIINEILKCTICQDIYKKPVNLKNCLHKFCKVCSDEASRQP